MWEKTIKKNLEEIKEIKEEKKEEVSVVVKQEERGVEEVKVSVGTPKEIPVTTISKDIKEEVKKEETKEEIKKPVTNTEETGIKRDAEGKFVEGTNPPPGPGRPKGSKDFNTILKEAFVMIAKAKGMDANSVEIKMVMRAVLEAMSGDFRYFQYLTDRRYGKVKGVLDLMGGLDLKGIDFNVVTNKEDLEKLKKKNEDTGNSNKHISPEP